MAVYICSKCRFCFERSGEVERCGDCGHINVRHATEDEAAEYIRNREEIKPAVLRERQVST